LQVKIDLQYIFATAKPAISRPLTFPCKNERLRNTLSRLDYSLSVGFGETSVMTPIGPFSGLAAEVHPPPLPARLRSPTATVVRNTKELILEFLEFHAVE